MLPEINTPDHTPHVEAWVPKLTPNLNYDYVQNDQYLISNRQKGISAYVNSNVYNLLLLIDGKIRLKELSVLYFENQGIQLNPNGLFQLLNEGNLNRFLYKENEDTGVDYSGLSQIFLKMTVVSEKYVWLICERIACLYRSKLSCILILFITTIFNFLSIYLYTHHSYQTRIAGTKANIILVYIFVLLSVILHEFGHAAACIANGIKPGRIGFGFYMFNPVFFADVNEAWKLPHKRRVMIDLGGIYIDMIVCSILMILLIYSNNELIFKVIVAKLVITIANLNPFMRFDGYWIMSDILNVTNLKTRSNKAIVKVAKMIKNFNYAAIHKADFLLALYGIISWTIIGAIIFYALHNNQTEILNFPKDIVLILINLTAKNMVWHDLVMTLKRMFIPFIFYYLVITFTIPYVKKKLNNNLLTKFF